MNLHDILFAGAGRGSLYDQLLYRKMVSSGEIITTEYAPIASFVTNKAQKALAVSVMLEPIQEGSGTPSPDNVRPISGRTEVVTQRTGVNVWDEEWRSGYYRATDGAFIDLAGLVANKNPIPVIPSTSYYIKAPTRMELFAYDKDGNFISRFNTNAQNTAFVTPTDAFYLCFNTYSVGAVTEYNNDISINYPSTDTDYHAYDGDTYTTSLGRTVYGGTLDVVSGELVVDRAMVTLDGSNDEVWSTQTRLPNAFSYVDSSIKNGLSQFVHVLSNYLEVKTQSEIAGSASQYGVAQFGWGTQLVVRIENITALADLKTYLASNPLQVVYELATPTTYQLTPTEVALLLGNNNVWSDGDVSVTYKR